MKFIITFISITNLMEVAGKWPVFFLFSFTSSTFCFYALYAPSISPCFTSSICSCHLLCVSFQAQTGLWVWTVLTCVMVTTGKKMCHWSFSRMMQGLTAGSPSLLQTLKLCHRTKLHRWVNLSQEQHCIQANNHKLCDHRNKLVPTDVANKMHCFYIFMLGICTCFTTNNMKIK